MAKPEALVWGVLDGRNSRRMPMLFNIVLAGATD
jgi:hypothetical protein